MNAPRRFTPYLAGALLVAGLVTGTSTHAVSSPAAPSFGKHGVIGHLAYVSKDRRIYTVAVKGGGNTLGRNKIGPVTTPPAGRRIAIYGFHASADGQYVAWEEAVTKRNGNPTRTTPTLVLHGVQPARNWTLKTSAFPIGFGGADQLIVSGAHTSAFVAAPSPHLQKIPGAEFPVAVYPGGVVQIKLLTSPPGPKVTEQVRLSTFAGQHTTLHSYVMKASDPRVPETAYVSPDGSRLIVERGDHTDFGGIGPSSLVDEFRLDGSRLRTPLGHFGTAKAAWRVGAASFAWPNDEPWVVFERATRHGGAKTAIAVYQHHTWRRILSTGIAVAGDHDGFVVAQPGKYVFNADGLAFARVPTSEALLLHEAVTKVLGFEASAVAWVARPS